MVIQISHPVSGINLNLLFFKNCSCGHQTDRERVTHAARNMYIMKPPPENEVFM